MSSELIDLLVLVPSMRISGGIQEILLLAEQLSQCGIKVQILSLCKSDYELPARDLSIDSLSTFKNKKSTAIAQYPLLPIKFIRYIHRKSEIRSVMVTHFSTFPLVWLAPFHRWYCFNQDIEWMFVPPGLARRLLRRLVLATSRRATVTTTNSFIESQYANEGINSVAQVSIWPDLFWISGKRHTTRSVDVVLLLRNGRMKRLDLYLDLLSKLGEEPGICCATVTPDSYIHLLVKDRSQISLLRPTNEELRDLYARSKIFVSLSDTEGFGVTFLEAMGQGCIPICHDSGGVRCYMTGSMHTNLIPLSEPIETIAARIKALLKNPRELASASIKAEDIFFKARKPLIRRGRKRSNRSLPRWA